LGPTGTLLWSFGRMFCVAVFPRVGLNRVFVFLI
jgi:hypothetical protein